MDDDLEILTLPYHNDLYAVYSKTNNAKVFTILFLQFFLTIAHWILCFVFPIKQHNFGYTIIDKPKFDLLNSYNLIVYSQMILWIFSLLIRYYLKNIYYRRLRILGYNNHYDKLKKYVLLPTLILHVSNALILLITALLNHVDQIELWKFHLKPVHISEIIISLSSISILITIKIHLYHEIKFRRFRNPPDVFCVDDPSRRLTSDGLNQISIRSYSLLEDLLENQADLIYNFKLQNMHLRELLYKATQNNSNNGTQQEENTNT